MEVEQKQRIGDLEINTILGFKGGKRGIITINDYKTKRLIIPIPCREAEIVKIAVIKVLSVWKFIKSDLNL